MSKRSAAPGSSPARRASWSRTTTTRRNRNRLPRRFATSSRRRWSRSSAPVRWGSLKDPPKGSMMGGAFRAGMAKKGGRPPIGTKGAAEYYWKRYTELYPKYFWSDETKLADIVVASAKGSLLYDVEGKEYIDLTSQWATNNLGNVHPEVLKATVDALERYGFLILFMNPHLPMIDVAERLLSIRPSSNLTRVFLELSGTGAAEGAVKHAIEASGRPLILSFMGQYHGLS